MREATHDHDQVARLCAEWLKRDPHPNARLVIRLDIRPPSLQDMLGRPVALPTFQPTLALTVEEAAAFACARVVVPRHA